jgi:sn-glycerol 3-phosphate transport system ATP-binding protein
LEVALDLVEPLGSESVLHGRLPTGEPLTARVAGAVPTAQGALRLVVPPAEAHVFDVETGRRLDPAG